MSPTNKNIDSINYEFAEKLKEFNSRGLKPDWFAIFLNAKFLAVKIKIILSNRTVSIL